jgi:rhodanese-related sulfurtransferase
MLIGGAVVHARGANAWFWSTPTWPDVKRKIRTEYPGISQITIAQLQEMLKKPDTFRLVDVRPNTETAVSHLPGAVFHTSSAQIAQAFSSNKNQNLVVYCSVGWRSAKIVSELQSMGFTQVSNLEGSIFEWANEGLPVFRGRERVKTVHPFDSTWQVLLKPELRALQ